jgi:ceramide glucosyltransferase
MSLSVTTVIVLGVAAVPIIYYLIALYSSWQFFQHSPERQPLGSTFTPPVSNLKPIRGLDPDAYENFASLCRQDYPDYELLFCVAQGDDPVLPVLEKLARDFPERRIRVLFGSGRSASNDKAAKLARLVSEARNDIVVINDSDVRVRPDYLRTVVAPLRNPEVGAVTCFYVPTEEKTFADNLQSIGMISDFYAGVLVGRQLNGVRFALGPTIATRRVYLAQFGGYEKIENCPGDDLLIGQLIADQGYEVRLLPYTVMTVRDYQSVVELIHKRLRWVVVMRHMRPWGHFGMLFTQGLPWSLAAIAIHPSMGVALGYLSAYLGLRLAITWMIGGWGLKQSSLWKRLPLIPVWDTVAFFIWLASLACKSVRWRGSDYYIRNGMLAPVTPTAVDEISDSAGQPLPRE